MNRHSQSDQRSRDRPRGAYDVLLEHGYDPKQFSRKYDFPLRPVPLTKGKLTTAEWEALISDPEDPDLELPIDATLEVRFQHWIEKTLPQEMRRAALARKERLGRS